MTMFLPMLNVIKLICITTGLIFIFIAVTLFIYGISGADACLAERKRDAYGDCSIRLGDTNSADTSGGGISAVGRGLSAQDLKRDFVIFAGERVE